MKNKWNTRQIEWGGLLPMSQIERLPVQHRLYPHCPTCKADMPSFDDCVMSVGKSRATLLAVTFHVQCVCRAKWDFRKTVKGS
jgi:hypothetical protein